MMLSILIFTVLLGSATAQFNYAVDINQLGTAPIFNCLFANHYRAVFIRSYKPDGNGGVDYNAVPNINMAFQAQLGVEVYMTPNPISSKNAAAQVDEAINDLKNHGVTVKNMWILVTSPINWKNDPRGNSNFITAAVQRIRAKGIRPGVYSNHYDWLQITNNQAGNLGSDVMLWYWNILGLGVGGETVPNFTDFRPFGQWQYANIKQFGQWEPLCQLMVNRNVYGTSVSNGTNSTGANETNNNGSVELFGVSIEEKTEKDTKKHLETNSINDTN